MWQRNGTAGEAGSGAVLPVCCPHPARIPPAPHLSLPAPRPTPPAPCLRPTQLSCLHPTPAPYSALPAPCRHPTCSYRPLLHPAPCLHPAQLCLYHICPPPAPTPCLHAAQTARPSLPSLLLTPQTLLPLAMVERPHGSLLAPPRGWRPCSTPGGDTSSAVVPPRLVAGLWAPQHPDPARSATPEMMLECREDSGDTQGLCRCGLAGRCMCPIQNPPAGTRRSRSAPACAHTGSVGWEQGCLAVVCWLDVAPNSGCVP